jgi:hypothetical protein
MEIILVIKYENPLNGSDFKVNNPLIAVNIARSFYNNAVCTHVLIEAFSQLLTFSSQLFCNDQFTSNKTVVLVWQIPCVQ